MTAPASMLPFRFERVTQAPGKAPFVIATMFSPAYAHLGERLCRSCRLFGLPHVAYAVPGVHRSIGRAGTADLAYTKANLISHVLAERECPVLYIDADCEIREYPQLVDELLSQGHDFAIYNWAADDQTDAYVPVKIVQDGRSEETRFYRFASSCDSYDPQQLICSGAVQLYADTAAVHALLAQWQDTIAALPGSADDHCLDLIINNRGPALAALRPAWLPKAYARYAWWIYVKPVIDHPQMAHPAGHFTPITPSSRGKQFYPERAQHGRNRPRFPRDCLIDVRTRRLVRVEEKRMIDAGAADSEFWV